MVCNFFIHTIIPILLKKSTYASRNHESESFKYSIKDFLSDYDNLKYDFN